MFRASRLPLAPRGEACTRTIRGLVGAGVVGVARPAIRAAALRGIAIAIAIATGSVVAVVEAVAAGALGIEVEDGTELDIWLVPCEWDWDSCFG